MEVEGVGGGITKFQSIEV